MGRPRQINGGRTTSLFGRRFVAQNSAYRSVHADAKKPRSDSLGTGLCIESLSVILPKDLLPEQARAQEPEERPESGHREVRPRSERRHHG